MRVVAFVSEEGGTSGQRSGSFEDLCGVKQWLVSYLKVRTFYRAS